MAYLDKVPPLVLQKAKKIKLLVSDLDGVLTDGGIILDDQGMEYKRFQVKDGQIIRYLKENGILIGILSGRDVAVSKNRCEQMKVDFHHHGVRDKYSLLVKIIEPLQLDLEEVAYIGDDLIDLELLSKVGLSSAPADAMPYVKEQVDYTTFQAGGQGAFRELADLLLSAKGHMTKIVDQLVNGTK